MVESRRERIYRSEMCGFWTGSLPDADPLNILDPRMTARRILSLMSILFSYRLSYREKKNKKEKKMQVADVCVCVCECASNVIQCCLSPVIKSGNVQHLRYNRGVSVGCCVDFRSVLVNLKVCLIYK